MRGQTWAIPAQVAEAWDLDAASAERISTGLINTTWRVVRHTGEAAALQRLSDLFDASVNERIAAVTAHLRDKGLCVPELLPTHEGAVSLHCDGQWRALSWIKGRVIERITNAGQAQAAAKVLARFSGALLDCTVRFPPRTSSAHDLPTHMANLHQALSKNATHPAHPPVTQLAGQLRELHARLSDSDGPGPARICHGDPKISNLIFKEDLSEAICMVDLDTIGYGHIAQELADAARSWCNPMGEDSLDTGFRLDYFEAMCSGWAESAGNWMEAAEWRAVPQAILNVCLCLTARFAADALNESYFGWDSSRYESASEHNLLRAQGQLQLAGSVNAQLAQLHSITGVYN